MGPLKLSLSGAAIKFDVEPDYLATVLAGHKLLDIALTKNLKKAVISITRT